MQNKQDDQQEIYQPFNLKVAISYSLLSFVGFVFSGILLMWFVLKQYGAFGSSPLQILTCTSSYFISKYSNTSIFVVMFFALILSLSCSLFLTVIWVSNVIRRRVSRRIKYVTVILESVQCLLSGAFLGYSLTFLIEISKMDSVGCSVSYNSDTLILLLGVVAANFVLSLVRYVIAATREFISEKQANETEQEAQNYQSLVNVTNQSFRQNEKPFTQQKVKKQTKMLQRTLPKVAKSQSRTRYIGQNQIVKPEQWETLAPSRASQKPEPKRIEEKKENPIVQSKSQFKKRDQPVDQNLNKNIFLELQSQASQNQPLFVPQQPFYYKSLAARTLGGYDMSPYDLPKLKALKKIQPQRREKDPFQMEQSQIEFKESGLKPVKVRAQKVGSYTPKIIRQNYERRLNKKN